MKKVGKIGRLIISLDNTGLFPKVCGTYSPNVSDDEERIYLEIMRELQESMTERITLEMENLFLYGDRAGKDPIGITCSLGANGEILKAKRGMVDKDLISAASLVFYMGEKLNSDKLAGK